MYDQWRLTAAWSTRPADASCAGWEVSTICRGAGTRVVWTSYDRAHERHGEKVGYCVLPEVITRNAPTRTGDVHARTGRTCSGGPEQILLNADTTANILDPVSAGCAKTIIVGVSAAPEAYHAKGGFVMLRRVGGLHNSVRLAIWRAIPSCCSTCQTDE